MRVKPRLRARSGSSARARAQIRREADQEQPDRHRDEQAHEVLPSRPPRIDRSTNLGFGGIVWAAELLEDLFRGDVSLGFDRGDVDHLECDLAEYLRHLDGVAVALTTRGGDRERWNAQVAQVAGEHLSVGCVEPGRQIAELAVIGVEGGRHLGTIPEPSKSIRLRTRRRPRMIRPARVPSPRDRSETTMTENRDFRETVTAAVKGDRTALGELLERNYDRLCAFVRVKAGGVVVAKESVADIVQSVCGEVLQDIDDIEYQGEAAFRSFLLLQATRKILNRHRFHHREIRDVRREEAAAGGDDAADLLQQYGTFCTPSRVVSAREEVGRIEEALTTLPENQRLAVAMSRMLGLSYTEIAQGLDCTESAARGLVARGLAQLSMQLGDRADESQ